MSAMLLSIKPQYAEMIIEGTKNMNSVLENVVMI